MSLSKHESDLRLSRKNTPRLKNSCLDVDIIEKAVIDTRNVNGRSSKSDKIAKNERNEKNEKTEKTEKSDPKTDFITDSRLEITTDYSKNASKKTSKNDSKQMMLGFKGRNSTTVANKPSSQITQKIKEELSLHSRTNVQLNLLMNKTMKWVMTQDFEGNAMVDARKLD